MLTQGAGRFSDRPAKASLAQWWTVKNNCGFIFGDGTEWSTRFVGASDNWREQACNRRKSTGNVIKNRVKTVYWNV